MGDEFHKVLAHYDQKMEGLDFQIQYEETRLAHLMDEEIRQRNLGEEAKKECELAQLQIDQLETDVDAIVQECNDVVDREAGLENALNETTARCEQVSASLKCRESALSSHNVTLEKIRAELPLTSAPVTDTISADKAIDKVKSVMNAVISPQVAVAAESKELLEAIRERHKLLEKREEMLQAKRDELLEMKVTIDTKRRMLEEKQKSISDLEEEIRSIDMEIASHIETERQEKEAIGELEKRCDELEAVNEAKTAEYAERNKREEALQFEISQLKLSLQERNEECEARKDELSRLKETTKEIYEESVNQVKQTEEEIADLMRMVGNKKTEIGNLNERVVFYRKLLDKRSEWEACKKEVEDLQRQCAGLKAMKSSVANELQQKECALHERETEAKKLDMDFHGYQTTMRDRMRALQDNVEKLERKLREEMAAAQADELKLESMRKQTQFMAKEQETMQQQKANEAKQSVKIEGKRRNDNEMHEGNSENVDSIRRNREVDEKENRSGKHVTVAMQLQQEAAATDSGFSSALSNRIKGTGQDGFREIKAVLNLFNNFRSSSSGFEEDLCSRVPHRQLPVIHSVKKLERAEAIFNAASDDVPAESISDHADSHLISCKQHNPNQYVEDDRSVNAKTQPLAENSLASTVFNGGSMVTSTPMLEKRPEPIPQPVRKGFPTNQRKVKNRVRKRPNRVKKASTERETKQKKEKDVFDLSSGSD